MWIVRLALRRPYTVAVFSALILIAGLLSVTRMRTDIFPSIDIPVVIVVWNYPGLSAEDMERRIVLISERAYSTTVDGITHIESQSISGIGLLKVYFEPDADIGTAIAQITLVSLDRQPDHAAGHPAPDRPPLQRRQRPGRADHGLQRDRWGAAALRLRAELPPGPALHHPRDLHAWSLRRQAAADHGRRRPGGHRGQGAQPQRRGPGAAGQSNVIIPAGTAQIGDTEYDVKLNSSPTTVDQFNTIPVKLVNGAPVLLRRRGARPRRLRRAAEHRPRQRQAGDLPRHPEELQRLHPRGGGRGEAICSPRSRRPRRTGSPSSSTSTSRSSSAPRSTNVLHEAVISSVARLADDPLLPRELPQRGHRLQLHPPGHPGRHRRPVPHRATPSTS